MRRDPVAVLLMAYGTPDSPADVEAYFTHIRGGRRPPPELVSELHSRYQAIGGRSPLMEITRRQAAALERRLNAGGGAGDAGEQVPYRVFIGMKHWRPFIADAVSAMAAAGLAQGVGLVLAPHYSRMSVGAYQEAANAAASAQAPPLRLAYVDSWHLHPDFIAALSRRVQAALARFSAAEQDGLEVIFTAHSLPLSILEHQDPYPRQLQETAAAVAEACGIRHWDLAWQSAGRTAVPWLGPDIKEVLSERHRQGQRALLICPAGFVADHLEVLYDIDIECRQLANQMGLHVERTASLNDDADFIAALAAVTVARAREAGHR